MKIKQCAMKMKLVSKRLRFALLALVIVLPLVACGVLDLAFHHNNSNAKDATRYPGPPSPADGPVAFTAMILQESVTGFLANKYKTDKSGKPTDVVLKKAYDYWIQGQRCTSTDANGKTILCSEAQSGSLQCVEFVTAAYGLAQDPLPFIGNGGDFYPHYVGRAGWKTISANTYVNNLPNSRTPKSDLPQAGDMAGWGAGPGDVYGHIAIVVKVQVPTPNQDGYITVANANVAGTTFPGSTEGGNYATFPWYKEGIFGSIKTLSDARIYIPFQGFIRHLNGHPVMPTFDGLDNLNLDSLLQGYGLQNLSAQQKQWATLAIEQAVRFGLPPQYFVKQINQESGFNDKAKSSAGAIGIAQFLPDTAAKIPRCILNPAYGQQLDCDKQPNSTPPGYGIDPSKPEEALPAAAYYMATHYQHFLHKCTGSPLTTCQIDPDQTMARALAAYNAGRGATDSALDTCGTSWLLCMDRKQPDHQTKNYIAIIMNCDVVVASGAVCSKT